MSTITEAAPAVKPARVRRPRAKPERRIRLLVGLSPAGKNAVARVTEGKKADDYFVDRVPSDWGDGFLVEKIGAAESSYHVHLDAQGQTCECKGFLHTGHCRHVSGLVALKNAGKL